jgi:hypothetical protein
VTRRRLRLGYQILCRFQTARLGRLRARFQLALVDSEQRELGRHRGKVAPGLRSQLGSCRRLPAADTLRVGGEVGGVKLNLSRTVSLTTEHADQHCHKRGEDNDHPSGHQQPDVTSVAIFWNLPRHLICIGPPGLGTGALAETRAGSRGD